MSRIRVGPFPAGLIDKPLATRQELIRKLGRTTLERGRRFRCTLIPARYEEEYLSEQPAKKRNAFGTFPAPAGTVGFAISAMANLSDAEIADIEARATVPMRREVDAE
jgi:hypothetical protein